MDTLSEQLLSMLDDLNDGLRTNKISGGLHPYYMQNLHEHYEEVQAKHEYRRKTIGQMEKILDNNKPEDDELLLVEALTGEERARIHAWAERNSYQSTRYKTEHFETNRLFHCTECAYSSYYEECIKYDDIGSCLGVNFGEVVKCPWCSETWWRYDSCDNSLRLHQGHIYNAVLIGKQLPKYSKSHMGNRKRTTTKPHDNDYYDVNKLPIRNYRKLKVEKFEHF